MDKKIMDEWIATADKLPRKTHKVLFHWICPAGNKNVSMGYLCESGWNIYLPYDSYELNAEYIKVTHWMEIPEFP